MDEYINLLFKGVMEGDSWIILLAVVLVMGYIIRAGARFMKGELIALIKSGNESTLRAATASEATRGSMDRMAAAVDRNTLEVQALRAELSAGYSARRERM